MQFGIYTPKMYSNTYIDYGMIHVMMDIMYAVVRESGRQFCLRVGEKVRIDDRGLSVGDQYNFSNILLYNDTEQKKLQVNPIGVVRAEVIAKTSIKTIAFYKTQRKNHKRKRGHRQHYAVLSIKSVDIQ